MTVKFKVDKRFMQENKDAVMFVYDELKKWNMARARWFRVIDKTGKTRMINSVWGNNTARVLKGTKTLLDKPISINCYIKGTEDDFPNTGTRYRRPDGRMYPHQVFDNVNDLFVWVTMHELYHFLCLTNQLPEWQNTETYCDNFADVMVHKFSGKDIRR